MTQGALWARLAPVRLAGAIAAARLAAAASKALRHGGTALPGLVALRIEPQLVRCLSDQLRGGTVIIAGTNGKTTTSLLTSAALQADGRRVVHNRAGSNLLRGVAATLCGRARLSGTVRHGRSLTGLFEVDEAALPGVLAQVRPSVLLLTNLFRDQLDRYGELQSIADSWRTAIAALPSSTLLVLNADDPLVASLGDAAPGKVAYYGIDGWPEGTRAASLASSADSVYCPHCGAPLRFSLIAYAHLGDWLCPSCGMSKPAPNVHAMVTAIASGGTDMQVVAAGEGGPITLRIGLPGSYNAYNALAALAAARGAGVALATAAAAVSRQRGAFGRAETIEAGGKTIALYLIKNPTGADEVLRVVAGGDRSGTLLVLLSDLDADGRDVSWIWDAQFERLAGWSGPVRCGGTRAEDMALRCKYAGLVPAVSTRGDIPGAVGAALDTVPKGGTLVVLATYTAMLAARDSLARSGYVPQYWETT